MWSRHGTLVCNTAKGLLLITYDVSVLFFIPDYVFHFQREIEECSDEEFCEDINISKIILNHNCGPDVMLKKK